MLLKLISKELRNIADKIDKGNSHLSEEEQIKIINSINEFSKKDKPLSKYQSCKYLNISRATFDNLIKEGKLPKGEKQQGFKELSWYQKDLDAFIKLNKE